MVLVGHVACGHVCSLRSIPRWWPQPCWQGAEEVRPCPGTAGGWCCDQGQAGLPTSTPRFRSRSQPTRRTQAEIRTATARLHKFVNRHCPCELEETGERATPAHREASVGRPRTGTGDHKLQGVELERSSSKRATEPLTAYAAP